MPACLVARGRGAVHTMSTALACTRVPRSSKQVAAQEPCPVEMLAAAEPLVPEEMSPYEYDPDPCTVSEDGRTHWSRLCGTHFSYECTS